MGFAPSITSQNQFRLVGFNQAKSLIPFSSCFSQDRLLFGGMPLDQSYIRGLHHDRLLCAQPALLPTILSATRTLFECFMRAVHLICRFVDFFSVFVVSSQRLLKYSRSIRQPRLFCTPMFLRVHVATFPTLWATATRDQVLKRNRLTARGNYMIA